MVLALIGNKCNLHARRLQYIRQVSHFFVKIMKKIANKGNKH